jgi:hypothetical protein
MKIDDRFLMVAITIAMAILYAFTKDALFGKMMEYTLVASFTMFVSPTKNWLITTASDSQVKAITSEFMGVK